jgi:WD repeat-containing protein 48
MLNDRRHALTFATGGKISRGNVEEDYGPQIAIWDIVRCICLGTFASEDVLALSTQGDNPGDLLEKVKERIEGRGATNSWCTADTKNGFLAVHLDWPSCFEAECYLDEYHWVERNNYLKDDQRGE